MKKFNMFALIALSLAIVGNVGAIVPGGTAAGFIAAMPTGIVNQPGQLKALEIMTRPTGNNLMSQAMNAGTPQSALSVSAMGTLKANTKAGTKAKFDSTAFQAGAQVTNEQHSQVAGGSNSMGQNVAASNNIASSMLTGANLKNINALSSAYAPTSAMSTLTSNTKNTGNVSFTNSGQPKWGAGAVGVTNNDSGAAGGAPAASPVPTPGTFGNVTSKIGLVTQGSSNAMGGSIGSSNNLNIAGNYHTNS